MPQLDKVTFLSQFFWLCFFYLGFYVVVLKFVLPKLSRILKLRKKKMTNSQEGITTLYQENEKVREHLNTVISKGLQTSRSLFHQNVQLTTNWLDKVLTETNKSHYQNINKMYIQSVGESSFSQNVALFHASSTSTDKLLTTLLLENLETSQS